MIKSVIDEEIENVPSKGYDHINKYKKDNSNLASSNKKRKMPETKKGYDHRKKFKKDNRNLVSSSNKQKNSEIRNEPAFPKKKREMTERGLDVLQSASPSTVSTWFYDPVDINWQRERATKLGLHVISSTCVTNKVCRRVLMNKKFAKSHYTRGDGNCFFRAISMYLTGKDDSHVILKDMLIKHMGRNMDHSIIGMKGPFYIT